MSYIISSGDLESGIILENDTMTVLDGGIANSTTVNSRGELNVSSGGTADSTTVNDWGSMFISGSLENWDPETLTYSDGGNSVTVSGVSADQVSLKFEYAGSKLFATLVNMGAFKESCTNKIFEDTSKGLLASV